MVLFLCEVTVGRVAEVSNHRHDEFVYLTITACGADRSIREIFAFSGNAISA